MTSYMLSINVEYLLDCDTCGFDRTVEDEQRAYGLAKEHETDYGDHFVLIETAF